MIHPARGTSGAIDADRTSGARALRAYYFVSFAAIGAYNPFFPTWLRARGFEGIAMSAVTALNPLLGIVSPLLFGIAADAFALRGSLLRIATFGAMVPMAAIALLGTGGHAIRYGPLFTLVAAYAFFRGPMVTIADVTALEEPGSYSRTRLFGSAGFTAMVVAAGTFLDPKSTIELPAVIAASLVVTLLITTRLAAKSARLASSAIGQAGEAKQLLRSPDFLLLLAAGFLWFASHVSYDLCFSLYLSDLGATPRYIGWAWATGVTAEILLMSCAPHLFARANATTLLSLGLIATAIRFALLSSIRSLSLIFALQPLHALSFALVWIASLEFVKLRAPLGALATAQSLFSVATALGSVTGLLVWGPLYAKSGGATVFGVAAAVAVVGSAAAMTLRPLSKAYGLNTPAR